MNQTIYREQGYRDRNHYLFTLSDEYGVAYSTVKVISSLLGADEDFDGLVNSLQDFSEGIGEY